VTIFVKSENESRSGAKNYKKAVAKIFVAKNLLQFFRG